MDVSKLPTDPSNPIFNIQNGADSFRSTSNVKYLDFLGGEPDKNAVPLIVKYGEGKEIRAVRKEHLITENGIFPVFSFNNKNVLDIDDERDKVRIFGDDEKNIYYDIKKEDLNYALINNLETVGIKKDSKVWTEFFKRRELLSRREH